MSSKPGTAQYVYTALGYLSQIKDNGTGTIYWTVNARDAELHLAQGTAGNSVVTTQSFDSNTGRLLSILAGTSNAVANFTYVWDTIGNLTSRADVNESYTERFCYDPLNRLTNYALGATCTSSGTKTVGYDALGDISSKSDVGVYAYPTSGSGSVRPHAVSSITGTVNGVVNPTFTYDSNGNMLTGIGRTVTPTSFNMAASIVQGSTSDCLTYDSEHSRIMQVQTTATCASPGSSALTTIYLNDPASGGMSEKFTSGATTTWRDYIAADNGLVAERFNTGGTVSVDYIVTDHLGSTSTVTSSSGTVLERNSFDPWGRQRNPNGTDASSCNAITSQITRGFTGQEPINAVCAINFNARLYDPTIGRFMSADSVIPNPFNGQSFNRFSYVNNGPLSMVDPSGRADCPPNESIGSQKSSQAKNDCGPTGPDFCSGCSTGSRIGGSNSQEVVSSGYGYASGNSGSGGSGESGSSGAPNAAGNDGVSGTFEGGSPPSQFDVNADEPCIECGESQFSDSENTNFNYTSETSNNSMEDVVVTGFRESSDSTGGLLPTYVSGGNEGDARFRVDNLVKIAYSQGRYLVEKYGPGSNPAKITELGTVFDQQAYLSTESILAQLQLSVTGDQLVQWGFPSNYIFGGAYYLYQSANSVGFAGITPPQAVLLGALTGTVPNTPESPQYLNREYLGEPPR